MKRYRSKPVPGVGDWEKINKSYGGNVEAYYQSQGDSGYYDTYHTLARKYGWEHESKENLPPGASRRISSTGQEVESFTRRIGDVHITINRYGKDDSRVQALIANLRTEHTASGTMPMSQVDKFIADNYE